MKELIECEGCKKKFEENDLDKVKGLWFCRDCEDEIDGEAEKQENFCN